ncbi:MAG: hypothetical protein V1759_00070 [bacterium]
MTQLLIGTILIGLGAGCFGIIASRDKGINSREMFGIFLTVVSVVLSFLTIGLLISIKAYNFIL